MYVSKGGIDAATIIKTSGGVYGYTGSFTQLSANNYYTDGFNYSGKTTGAFSFKAYVNGSETYVGMNFMNGILVGISGF